METCRSVARGVSSTVERSEKYIRTERAQAVFPSVRRRTNVARAAREIRLARLVRKRRLYLLRAGGTWLPPLPRTYLRYLTHRPRVLCAWIAALVVGASCRSSATARRCVAGLDSTWARTGVSESSLVTWTTRCKQQGAP